MGRVTSIEWTDHTFNPWWGCVRVSPGCVHCYAETFDKRVHGKEKAHWGVGTDRRFFGDKHWNEPLRWNRDAEKDGVRRRVFCASMADVFEDRPDLVEPRARLFLLIQNTPWLDWQLLTKRPENMVRLAAEHWPGRWPENVWAGCTVEDQRRADERLPHLADVPAAIRFLSCEPLLERVNLTPWFSCPHLSSHGIDGTENRFASRWECDGCGGRSADGDVVTRPGIDWIIIGGESGPGARAFNIAWAEELLEVCEFFGVAAFVKQLGARPFRGAADAPRFQLPDISDSKGGDWSEWPEDLRVRRLPCRTKLDPTSQPSPTARSDR